MNIKFLIISISLAAFGCNSTSSNSQKTVTNDNKTQQNVVVNSTPSIAQSPTPNTNTAVVAKNFNGTGIITKINLELVSVELNHEEIKGLMPAMIMEFYVKDKKQVEVLKVGDKADFILEDKAGSEIIIDIKKAK